MARTFFAIIIFLNIFVGNVFAYDAEYGDDPGALPPMTLLNPLDGKLITTSEMSLFGRPHPIFGVVKPHQGMDIAADYGDNIYAAHDGEVVYSGWASGYGNCIYVLTTINGHTFETGYAHCSILLVGVGTKVSAGTIIAKAGSTGNSTRPHLHFELRIDGKLINPRRYLNGLSPSTGAGYGTLPDSLKYTFDAAYDFGKPLRESIEKFGKQCQEALSILLNIVRWFFVALIIIDLALGSSFLVLSDKGFFDYLLRKVLLYAVLIFFLTNFSTYIANFAKDMFAGFGGMMMGASMEDAMTAISNPMDIVSKGAEIVSPIYHELFKIQGLFDLMTKVPLWLPSLFFAVILTICFFVISLQLTMAYLEFYFVTVFSFSTFFFSGLKQTRKYAANGLNGIFAVSIKLMFFCMFSLMLQMILHNIEIDAFYSQHQQAVPVTESGESAAITSIEQLMARIKQVESSNRYYVDNGQGYFGAYQIDYAHYDNWTHWTNDYVANGGILESGPVMENEPHGPAWTPTNQDNIARYIMTGYYNKYGSYEAVARAWNQGENGMDKPEASVYWAKVMGVDPSTGLFTSSPTLNINLLFKVTFVLLMFVYMGSKVSKLILKDFGGSGFRFTNEQD